jgi:hypothetical protein
VLRQVAAPTSSAVQYESLGHQVCTDLAAGNTVEQEVTMLYRSHLPVEVTTGVLAGAMSGYCPQYRQGLQPWANVVRQVA